MRTLLLVCAGMAVGALVASAQQPFSYPLDSPNGLRLQNVIAQPAELLGKKGLFVTMADEALSRLKALPREQRELALRTEPVEQLAVIDGLSFGNGVIEVELAGVPDTSVFEGARAFVGVAFRLQNDLRTYDAFYLRPTNGRADDQVRRNHSVQYISHPSFTWFRLRTESPEKYESYVDLVPGEWTAIRIEVHGTRATLSVHGQAQPTLVVNDLKTGANAKGAIALWLDVGTRAHFRNLRVTQAD